MISQVENRLYMNSQIEVHITVQKKIETSLLKNIPSHIESIKEYCREVYFSNIF